MKHYTDQKFLSSQLHFYFDNWVSCRFDHLNWQVVVCLFHELFAWRGGCFRLHLSEYIFACFLKYPDIVYLHHTVVRALAYAPKPCKKLTTAGISSLGWQSRNTHHHGTDAPWYRTSVIEADDTLPCVNIWHMIQLWMMWSNWVWQDLTQGATHRFCNEIRSLTLFQLQLTALSGSAHWWWFVCDDDPLHN